MSFVVEDGTGLPNANAYASVAMYRAYHSERGRVVTNQTDAQIKAFLIRATDHIERENANQFKGSRLTLVQSLSFPRSGITLDGVDVPTTVAHAASVASGGSGYVVGDVVTLVGGTFTTAATFRVDTVLSGAATSLSVVNRGDYTSVPSSPVAVTGGTGTGLTLSVTFGIALGVVQATIEYGLRASKYADLVPDGPVSFDREGTDGSSVAGTGLVIEKSEKVGPIEESVRYVDPSLVSTSLAIPKYPAADAMLAPFLLGNRGGKVIRN